MFPLEDDLIKGAEEESEVETEGIDEELDEVTIDFSFLD